MDILHPVEVRVLGALLEKDIATPEYYPLSLNALVNASNQKNNREPVMSLAEADVRTALFELEGAGLVVSQKKGRVRTCRIEPKALAPLEAWLHARRTEWEGRLDRLGRYLEEGADDAEPDQT